jgi:hypothetical protein
MDTYEQIVTAILNKTMEAVREVVYQSLDSSNSMKMMVEAGSKGDTVNIAQVFLF